MRLRARGISPGIGRGDALVMEEAFSFLGGVDAETGELRLEGRDESVRERVLVFPSGKGSTVGSYVILDLERRGMAPAAIVNTEAEPIVATGAVMAGIPMVDDVDATLIRDGDTVIVDADAGTVELPDVVEVQVVTSILRSGGEVLILKRSQKVRSYKGMWAGVSGSIKAGEEPLEAAMREVFEEVGPDRVSLVMSGEPLRMRDGEVVWVVHPFLFEMECREVEMDWEHVDCRWINASHIAEYDAVPGLDDVYRRLGLL